MFPAAETAPRHGRAQDRGYPGMAKCAPSNCQNRPDDRQKLTYLGTKASRGAWIVGLDVLESKKILEELGRELMIPNIIGFRMEDW